MEKIIGMKKTEEKDATEEIGTRRDVATKVKVRRMKSSHQNTNP